jgi:hypothetical protein
MRYIGPVIAALTAFSPSISNAWPGRASFDACVAAFEKTLPEAAPDRAYKVVFSGDRFSGSIAWYFQSAYTFDLSANDTRGGVLARARCSTDYHGAVISLVTLRD